MLRKNNSYSGTPRACDLDEGIDGLKIGSGIGVSFCLIDLRLQVRLWGSSVLRLQVTLVSFGVRTFIEATLIIISRYTNANCPSTEANQSNRLLPSVTRTHTRTHARTCTHRHCLFHVCWGLPLFRFPCGLHARACRTRLGCLLDVTQAASFSFDQTAERVLSCSSLHFSVGCLVSDLLRRLSCL